MLIIFTISNDSTTTDVIDWIKQFDPLLPCIRINVDQQKVDFLKIHSTGQNSDLWIRVAESRVNLFDVKVAWYRKGGNLFIKEAKENITIDEFPRHYVKQHFLQELNTLSDYTYYRVEQQAQYALGSRSNATPNKLHVLHLAQQVGLSIPDYWIIKSKEELLDILKQHSVITKSLSDGIYLSYKGNNFYTYTEKIVVKDVQNISANFFPSLIQREIKKALEIRSFFLDGKFYSMAIISQNDEQTTVDFRKYNLKKPNRNIPYKLPGHIEEKLFTLCEKLGLNTGSADLILNENGDYVFLEINPVGQFGMVSDPCNYYLEKEVAKLLYTKWKDLS